MIFSFLMILGVGVISIWDGFRNELIINRKCRISG